MIPPPKGGTPNVIAGSFADRFKGWMKSAVTICLVPEARLGPFVFHTNLAEGCALAKQAGFDAVEIFPPSAAGIDEPALRTALQQHGLGVAAIGTGAGWVIRKLSLTSVDAAVRAQARAFIREIIEVAGRFGAPAILGSMQGRVDESSTRADVLGWLAEALEELGEAAAKRGVPFLYEPLNRYETNLFNRQEDAASFLRTLKTRNVRLLCDLFHMAIEEADLAATLRACGSLVGHVHFADSNRRAIGLGHTDATPIVGVLREIGYDGYLSAEILPLPDATTAAAATISAFRNLTRPA
jgi:sugar phosphate isomerase/epimerase